MEYRLKFSRGDEVKYISHLDIMKVFEMTMRRAKIKISYSQGFNPHPNIVFGLPMGVGLVSLAEYMDISLEENLSPNNLKSLLNENLPDGFNILDAKIKEQKKNIMSQIAAARYEIALTMNTILQKKLILQKIDEFVKKDTIMVLKKSKKSERIVDIKPLVLNINFKESKTLTYENRGDDFKKQKRFILEVLVKAGQNGNLKPALLVDALNDFLGDDANILNVVRTQLYIADQDERFVLPM